MRIYVGVTDGDWFRFLAERSHLDEVNFWQPGGNRLFGLLSPGEVFLFKLHAPRNFIVGGGTFEHASIVPLNLAWESFGEKNGVASLAEMRTRLAKYRKAEPDSRANYNVGCVILGSPFFLEERDWIPAPADFHPNIVQGKTYRLAEPGGRALWTALSAKRMDEGVDHAREEAPMFGDPMTVTRRLGQGAFRLLVTDRYERRCAVTREKVLPVLEAAHIKPVATGGTHRIDNGVLLRSDLHTLFDAGYVTIDPGRKVRVSRKLEDEFDNGKVYYAFDGTSIWLPPRAEDRPAREFLEWHADSVFLG